MPDHVMIYPNHGAGSPCGADIGARLSSTIGYERKFNKFLQFPDVKSFTDYAVKTAPPVPHYYPVMKKLNAKGPEILGIFRAFRSSAKAFKKRSRKRRARLLMSQHARVWRRPYRGRAEHRWFAILSIWAGWMLDPKEPILLVLEDETASKRLCASLFAPVTLSSRDI
jgi:hydroxyacylglutathione hydrolase